MKKILNRGITLATPAQGYGSVGAEHIAMNTTAGLLMVCVVEEIFDMVECTQTRRVRPMLRSELEEVDCGKET